MNERMKQHMDKAKANPPRVQGRQIVHEANDVIQDLTAEVKALREAKAELLNECLALVQVIDEAGISWAHRGRGTREIAADAHAIIAKYGGKP